MTKEELQELIDLNIKGQFNQIDMSGKLADILSAMLNGSVPVEVEDITDIDGDVLDALNCGDKVVKVTGKQKHCYTVSYKGDGVGQGLCLTYADASVVETVSYDFTDDGWVYNSTDTTDITS